MKKFGLKKYTLKDFFDQVVKRYADRPALAFTDETPITYREFGNKVQILQKLLKESGIKKGDHLAILGPSSPNWAITFIAITTMGAVAVPILEEFPESDINHILHHSDSKGLFVSASIYESMDLTAAEKLTFVISLDDFLVLFTRKEHTNIVEVLSSLPDQIMKKIFKEEETVEIQDEIKEDDVAEIIYTSGTTGFSKGVMLTHGNLVSNLFEGPDLLGVINEKSVILLFLPMAHTFGSTSGFLSIIYCGSLIYFMRKKPSPKILLSTMQKVKPTIIGAVPLIFEKIYHKRILPMITGKKILSMAHKWDKGKKVLYKIIGKKVLDMFGGRLECAIIGGASLSSEVEQFLRWGNIPYALGYGLTECSPLVTFSSMENAKFGSVGHAITDVEIKIENKDPKTGIGDILVKGPNVMKGYYKNEEATKEVFTDDGWFITGDKGRLDDDGFLYITGRTKNVIIGPSGENIYPEAIEGKFKQSLLVEEVFVHEMDGKLVARIYPDFEYINSTYNKMNEEELSGKINELMEQLRQEMNHNLPTSSKISRIIVHYEPFNKTPTNKIKRYEYMT